MKNTKRVLTLAMAIVMLMTLVVSANAAIEIGQDAGIYGRIRGLQNWTNGEDVITGTDIDSNPDNAYLVASVEMLNIYGTEMRETSQTSDYGETHFVATHRFAFYINETPSCVWVCHEVRGVANAYEYHARLAYNA